MHRNTDWSNVFAMIKSLKLALISVLLVSLLACGEKSPLESRDLDNKFEEKFPLDDMNNSLQLGLDGEDNTFAKNSDIPIYIYNKSGNPISINNNVNMMLFMAGDSDWIEIKNALTYPDSLPIAPQGTPLLDFRYTWVSPVLSEELLVATTEYITIRILILGELMENDQGTGDLIGAYIDVFVKNPK